MNEQPKRRALRKVEESWRPLDAARGEDAAEIERLRQRVRELEEGLLRLQGTNDHPEHSCEECGGRNIVWFVDSALWNKHHGGFSVLCPICFVNRVEASESDLRAWKLIQEN